MLLEGRFSLEILWVKIICVNISIAEDTDESCVVLNIFLIGRSRGY